MSTVDWTTFNQALCHLAKRKNPKADGWVYNEDHGMYQCYICEGSVWYLEFLEHGLVHIKEHNLLIFL